MADFLATLRDVNLAGLADGSPIYWDNTAKQWKTAGTSYTPTFYDAAGVPALFSSGSFAGLYSKIGRQVVGEAICVTGTGAFTPGHVYVDLPVAIGSAWQIVGQWALLTSGTPPPSGNGFVICTSVGTTKAELMTSAGAFWGGTPGSGETLSVNYNYLANA